MVDLLGETNAAPPALPSPAVRAEDLGIGILFEVIRDAAIVGDATTGHIVLWNPAAERLFGYRADEAIGQSLEILVPGALRERHRTGLAAFARTGRGPLVDGDEPAVLPTSHRDGGEMTVELSLTPLSVPERPSLAAHRYVLALIRDATARERLAAEREVVYAAAQAAADRLGKLVDLKAGFTAMAAHELGTPVATIRGLVDILAAGDLAEPEQAALLAAIRSETDLVHRLVADVEAAAAVERDDFGLQPHPVPVALMLAELAAFAQTLPGDHPIRESVDESVMMTRVFADPQRIGQVLRNLLGNASKHTPPGTTIELRVREDGARVRIDVADEGQGIPAGDLERIFTKFGRGRDAEGRRTPGVGLGLYLSRRIIEAHGSELTVTTRPGEGTTFGFHLEIAA
ncbi:MAG: hypothetical protein AVDCRST_MAG70-356 [uncultured Thermomicrobiales bacterium]|uniref:histidine kinase n=1 Tax=uncultured Thermomicrobiales bacterium TaxID=1645740 RepID=A0A6J4U946_9BACT|nr:MAG: hypothetical protein AVDCRST_MAG70-356 [uncultured Thermomicrobiales bacterium]